MDSLGIMFCSGPSEYQSENTEAQLTVLPVREKTAGASIAKVSAHLKWQALWKQRCGSSPNQISTTQLFITHCINFVKVLTPRNKQNKILLSNPNEVDWISLFISRDAERIFYTRCMESLSSSSIKVSPCAIISPMCYFYLLIKLHNDQPQLVFFKEKDGMTSRSPVIYAATLLVLKSCSLLFQRALRSLTFLPSN